MDNPASVSDIETRWRPLTDQEQSVAGALIGDAWRMIRRTLTDSVLDEKSTDATTGEDYVADVRMVISNAVIRVLMNPEGKRQESIDDYSFTVDRARSAGMLYITGDEWALLGTTDNAGAFQIDATPTSVLAGDYLPVEVTGIPSWLDWT